MSRHELVIVGVLSLLGLLLRAWHPQRMAVEHFDEGVYASNLYCPPQYQYPARYLYAPPLLPSLLEWFLILGGTPVAAMAVNVLAGSLTVTSVWWVTRNGFGPVAALAATTLAATSEFHIAFSRMALTDVLLCLWMLWGVYFAWRGIITGIPVSLLLAGLFAALAWWTKYNGWLTLAISGAGLLAWLCVQQFRPGWSPSVRWGTIAGLAVIGWLPVLWDLQSVGGYAVVSANHARYFGGLEGWWDRLTRQFVTMSAFDGPVTRLGLLAAVVCPAILVSRNRDRLSHRAVPVLLVIAAAGMLGGSPLALSVLGIGGVILSLTLLNKPAVAPTHWSTLAVWMLTAWLVGLLVAVPLYHPYPRLTLPWLVAAWMAAGLGISRSVGGSIPGEKLAARQEVHWSRLVIASVVLWCGSVLWGLTSEESRTSVAWQSRAVWVPVAGQLLGDINQLLGDEPTAADGPRGVVYVVGEPGLFFHLANQVASRGEALLILPAGDLAMVVAAGTDTPLETFAITAQHAQRSPLEESTNSRLQPMGTYPYRPSFMVLIDEYPPAVARDPERLPSEEVRLYRATRGE